MATKKALGFKLLLSSLRNLIHMIDLQKLALSTFFCSYCNDSRTFVKFNDNEVSVRCLSCGSTPIILSLISVLKGLITDLKSQQGYELSARGRLVKFLKKNCRKLNCSEYYDGLTSGEYHQGIQCQDVQKLSFENECFDFCTSTEVFEHVPDDSKGFAEIYRVLKPKGVFIFTVPLDMSTETIERAVLLSNGKIKHLHTPEFHGNPIQRDQPILAFRNYGYNILDKLQTAGFVKTEVIKPGENNPWGYFRHIIVAVKG